MPPPDQFRRQPQRRRTGAAGVDDRHEESAGASLCDAAPSRARVRGRPASARAPRWEGQPGGRQRLVGRPRCRNLGDPRRPQHGGTCVAGPSATGPTVGPRRPEARRSEHDTEDDRLPVAAERDELHGDDLGGGERGPRASPPPTPSRRTGTPTTRNCARACAASCATRRRSRLEEGAFLQLIEFHTGDPDRFLALAEEWRERIGRDATARWAAVTADRDRPNTYVELVAFPDFAAAMRNSEHPATGEFAKKLQEAIDGEASSATSTSAV